ncbi:neutral/alkaline non-lysosomal ceramidase N-terminal domain-containing protein [Prosthecobacter sp.]|uniref:neutral/alkaline non-lysosomal ceramidase N-terminal domain-containing protein n=1 Tax=Prosthecobacter sp. TaxID=1965333 RepID=UPI0024894084|nr:neutral/alkaline non-lysosomal ceramidase N-terminal domain-containing protein [Prosthecobacter sp.]MDI1313631.1 neutral/alkaline non-lysosomal ceramidase N-terminal domain-containing protein [Prosthecobacter sp.]
MHLRLFAFLLLSLPGFAASLTHPAGAASIDITPDYPVRLSGYGGRRAPNTGVSQHIFAKALAIGSDDAEGPAILLTVDNVGVPASIRTEVLRRLQRDTKATDARFAICSSHTHCAPMLIGILPNIFGMDIPAEHLPAIERYTRELTDNLEKVARAALADRKPSSLAWGIGKVGFAANRRFFPLKPIDHDLPVLRITRADGKVRAIFTSYACHCTTIGIDEIHGDWAGVAQEALQREFPGAIALTALGCGADQNPTPRRTMELVKQYGEDLGAEAKRVATSELKPLTGPLSCQTKQIDLAFDTLPTREEWQTLAASKTPAIAYHAQKNLARLDHGEKLPTHLPYLVQRWSFGNDLAMVFLPGEVTVDYSLRIKREYDRSRLWVNGYSNDVPCYIPSRRVLEEGGYEGAGAMVYYDRPTKFAPDVEDRIIGAVQALMPKDFIAKSPQQTESPKAIAYPDHSNLLLVRGRPVQTATDWAERVTDIKNNMQQVMGPLHDTSRWTPLNIQIISEEKTEKYLRRKIHFTPEVGDHVPAWLLIPNDAIKAPAMLCLHQTTQIGKDEPAGLGGKPSLHYAHELAERGYICLVPDYPSFGEYPYDFKTQGAHRISGSMKAIYNNLRAVDLLQSLPQVNKDHIGVIGHSLGGHNALFTAVFDDRIKAVVTSCGFTPFHDYYGGKVTGWTSDRYMPRIRDIYENNADKIPFDFYEVLAAIAPRGVFSNSPLHDSNFDITGVRKAFTKAGEVYDLLKAKKNLTLVTPDAPHDFPEPERKAAYQWLDQMLK